jgi:hypothetical protein
LISGATDQRQREGGRQPATMTTMRNDSDGGRLEHAHSMRAMSVCGGNVLVKNP